LTPHLSRKMTVSYTVVGVLGRLTLTHSGSFLKYFCFSPIAHAKGKAKCFLTVFSSAQRTHAKTDVCRQLLQAHGSREHTVLAKPPLQVWLPIAEALKAHHRYSYSVVISNDPESK